MKRKTAEAIDDYLNRFRLLKARDMAQLADRVRQVERLRAEKARNSKFHKKEKVAYIETYGSENEFDDDQEYMENNEGSGPESLAGRETQIWRKAKIQTAGGRESIADC
ncbi:hypothetical protein P8452_28998 [Trifolium repens]|nr:hypothetical protein P8452_28998 [Trifolium repens]